MTVQGNPIQVNVNQPFWDTKRALVLGCSLSAATLCLTIFAQKHTKSPLPENATRLTNTIHLIVSTALENPTPTAICIASMPFVPQILKSIGKTVKFCFYDYPTLGAVIASSIVTVLGMTYGPKIANKLLLNIGIK